MNDMKLIMEGWRRYSAPPPKIPMMLFENGKVDFFYLDEKINLLKEGNRDSEIEILFEKWLDQSELILEIGIPKFIKDFASDERSGQEIKPEFLEMIKDLIENPFLTLSIQLWGFLQKIKNVSIPILAKAAKVLGKIDAARKSFEKKNPLLYKVLSTAVKVAVVFLVVYAVHQISKVGLCEDNLQEGCKIGDKVYDADSSTMQVIIGEIAKTDPGLAKGVAKLAQSPETYDVSQLTPGIRDLIQDAHSSVGSLIKDIARFERFEGLADQDISKLQQFRETGREILNSVSKTAESLGDVATATSGTQVNVPMLAQQKLMSLMQVDNVEKAVQLLKDLKSLDVLSPEDFAKAVEAVKAGDNSILKDLALEAAK
tara:strand:- start:66 stop:1178 length:1113 start_codon:yes stop_codon:yes gene_type:complete